MRDMLSKRFGSRIALYVFGPSVPAHDVPLRVEHVQGVITHAFDEQAKSLLVVGDVANGGGDEAPLLRLYWAEADLDGDFASVRALRPELQSDAHGTSRRSGEKSADVLFVDCKESLGNEAGELRTAKLFKRPAE
jgi:hypothetical protein